MKKVTWWKNDMQEEAKGWKANAYKRTIAEKMKFHCHMIVSYNVYIQKEIKDYG